MCETSKELGVAYLLEGSVQKAGNRLRIYAGIGSAHEAAQEYDKAATFYRRALQEQPNASWIYRNLASSLSGAGRIEEAMQAFAEMMRHYPDLTVSKYKQAMVFSPAVLDVMGENLRRVGLPD